ncbi:hypothetical protein TRVA0_019S00738 [Trichomonascus vanleenenianus]|uniref:uncharacterized protein n=1 Tax=Trichomonascus vanleenenianus TaxID=2268995 RepID=UPI003EC992B4
MGTNGLDNCSPRASMHDSSSSQASMNNSSSPQTSVDDSSSPQTSINNSSSSQDSKDDSSSFRASVGDNSSLRASMDDNSSLRASMNDSSSLRASMHDDSTLRASMLSKMDKPPINNILRFDDESVSDYYSTLGEEQNNQRILAKWLFAYFCINRAIYFIGINIMAFWFRYGKASLDRKIVAFLAIVLSENIIVLMCWYRQDPLSLAPNRALTYLVCECLLAAGFWYLVFQF